MWKKKGDKEVKQIVKKTFLVSFAGKWSSEIRL